MRGATRFLRISVVALWVGLLGYFFWEQRGTPSNAAAVPDKAFVPAGPDETWMGLYLKDKKIGYMHQRLASDRDGYRFEEQSLLNLTVLGQPQTVNASSWGRTGSNFALRSFSMSLQSGVGSLEATGVVKDDQLALTIKTGAETSSQSVPLSAPVYLPGNARLFVARSGLEEGREYSLRVFDPTGLNTQDLFITVVGKEPLEVDGRMLMAWKIRERLHGVESDVWLDDAGHVLREVGPMGLTAVRETNERAVTGFSTGDGSLDLAAAVAVPVDKPLTDARTLGRLVVRLVGIDDMTIPNDPRQNFRNGILTIVREDDADSTFTLPYVEPQWRSELERTTFLQVDHPRVVATATEILDGETDARRAAERLRLWVFESLLKIPTASLPNALQVLDMKQGDCNEHAVLFAALARAAGLPARVVAGTVYVDDKFLYHAWNEVWLGSGWVSVDAALNQMPVDATHIKLVEGGPETHAALLPAMGRLKVEVESQG